jgi:simple sugar transport system permease protein
MMRFEPRQSVPAALAIAAPVGAGIVALLLAAIPLAFAGAPILASYGLMFRGAFGSLFTFSETLTRTTPLILTGLAAAVAFRRVSGTSAARASSTPARLPRWRSAPGRSTGRRR